MVGSNPTLLLTHSVSWQVPAIEGPTIVRNGGTYYLFYGVNNWDSASAGIGYVTSSSVLGSYTNQSIHARGGTTGNATGPQGPRGFTSLSGATRMALAAWDGPVGHANDGVRALWIGSLGFDRSEKPSLSWRIQGASSA